MPIYEFTPNEICRLETTTFSSAGLHERRDLQRLIREQIEVIADEALVIAEEFGDWDDSRRRIDLLAIDKGANIVVIELKRAEDGGHMELQSIRYASMVSTMTFDQASDVFGRYLKQSGKEDRDPRATMLEFLGWDEPDDEQFAQDVRIVLASAEFSKELASSLLWLIDHGIDIRCIRLNPYALSGRHWWMSSRSFHCQRRRTTSSKFEKRSEKSARLAPAMRTSHASMCRSTMQRIRRLEEECRVSNLQAALRRWDKAGRNQLAFRLAPQPGLVLGGWR
jgi:hypothetical protein